MRDLVDLRRAGGAEDQGDAIEKKRGGKGAKQKVLDGGLGARPVCLRYPARMYVAMEEISSAMKTTAVRRRW